jgi:hypothetical protein
VICTKYFFLGHKIIIIKKKKKKQRLFEIKSSTSKYNVVAICCCLCFSLFLCFHSTDLCAQRRTFLAYALGSEVNNLAASGLAGEFAFGSVNKDLKKEEIK